MVFFTSLSIQNPASLQLNLWQIAEEYLNPLSLNSDVIKAYPLSQNGLQTLALTPPAFNQNSYESNFVITALKIISYVMIFPLVIAAGVCIYNRVSSSFTKDLVREHLLQKNKIMEISNIFCFMRRISKTAYKKNLPYCCVSALDHTCYSSVFKKGLIRGKNIPKTMLESYPPKEGRLAILLHKNTDQHYVNLFLDFDKNRIFYYDPLGSETSCPIDIKKLSEIYFPYKKKPSLYVFSNGTHQKDGVNCGKYALKFFDLMMNATNTLTTFENFSKEQIPSEKIYTYIQEICETYSLWSLKPSSSE